MPKALIVYHSKTGRIREMAEVIEEGMASTGVQVICKPVAEVEISEMLQADGIFVGSPNYYGSLASEVKALLDKTAEHHGRLAGKVGGGFCSSATIGGGGETTVLSILNSMLIHGMIVQGDPAGDHYGPIAGGEIDGRVRDECKRFGKRMGLLLLRLFE